MAAYIVEVLHPIEAGKRIIRASTAQQALRYVWRMNSSVKGLSQDELLAAIMDEGLEIEDARSGTDDVPPPPSADGNQTYAHKIACPAGSETPIGKGNCKCPDLDL